MSDRNLLFKSVARRTAGLLLVAVVASSAWLGWKLYASAAAATGSTNPLQLVSAFTPSPLKETNGRVNILLAGYSADDSGHQGADLTDSIMIVSVNPTDKSAVVISVPRDLYVNIPGYGYSKINAAYEYGAAQNFKSPGYPDGGMGLLEETLSQDFGVSFNYYALINYTAFKSTVDAVGGVSVNIQSSDPRGLYDPNTNLNLANGLITLSGQQALDLARSRGDGIGSYGFPNSDFSRTQNQQLILLALKSKLSSASVMANPVRLGDLATAIGSNVKTDMKVGELETLYAQTKGISTSSIKTISLDKANGQVLLEGYTTSDGQSALIPTQGIGDFSNIQALVTAWLANGRSS